MDTTPHPTEIKLHQKSRVMELVFSDGSQFELSYELLRVYSTSAEVQGHGPGQEVLQVGQRAVDIVDARAGRQLRRAADVLRRPQHGYLLLGAICSGWAPTAMSCGGNTSSAWRRPGQVASGRSAFRAATEIEIAEPPRGCRHHDVGLRHCPQRRRPSRSSSSIRMNWDGSRSASRSLRRCSSMRASQWPASIFRCRSSIPTS